MFQRLTERPAGRAVPDVHQRFVPGERGALRQAAVSAVPRWWWLGHGSPCVGAREEFGGYRRDVLLLPRRVRARPGLCGGRSVSAGLQSAEAKDGRSARTAFVHVPAAMNST